MSLQQLLLIQPEEFLSAHWPDRPLVVHGDPGRFGPLASIDVFALMSAAPREHTCLVYLENDASWRDDLHMPIAVARRFLARGNTVEIPNTERLLPEAGRIMRSLVSELGGQDNAASVSLFHKGIGKGTPPHFDDTEVFVVQTRGRCVWRIAENPAVRYPTRCHYLAEQHPAPVELRLQLREGQALPVEMPPHHEVVEMRAGSALFLPRGYLHETLEAEDSVSLTFSTHLPTAADVFTALVGRFLQSKEGWRRPVAGLHGSPDARARAQQELEQLVTELLAGGEATLGELRSQYQLIPALRRAVRRRP